MEPSCLGFAVECGTLWKGAGVTIMGFTLFIFSTFVMLSAACPSRLLSAFPPGVQVSRVTLEEAVARVAAARRPAPGSVGERGGELSPDPLQRVD